MDYSLSHHSGLLFLPAQEGDIMALPRKKITPYSHTFYIIFLPSTSLDFPTDLLYTVHPPAWSAVKGKLEVLNIWWRREHDFRMFFFFFFLSKTRRKMQVLSSVPFMSWSIQVFLRQFSMAYPTSTEYSRMFFGWQGRKHRFLSGKTSWLLITKMWIHVDKKKKKKTCPVEPALNSLLPFCCYSLYFPVFLQMF